MQARGRNCRARISQPLAVTSGTDYCAALIDRQNWQIKRWRIRQVV
jgi:hypothetical protein